MLDGGSIGTGVPIIPESPLPRRGFVRLDIRVSCVKSEVYPLTASSESSPEHNEIEVIARALALRAGPNGPVVLVCRALRGGYCYLPGGHVEFNEPASLALVRELDEEAGVQIRVGTLGLMMEERFTQGDRHRHEYALVFHVEHIEGEDISVPPTARPPIAIDSREEHIAFEWIALADLEESDLRPPRIRAWLGSAPNDRAVWLGSA